MNNILEMIKNEKVEWKKLGDVCEIGTGKSNTNQQVENGKYPFYVRSKDIKRIDEYEFDEEAIIIPGEGGIGEIYHYINGKYALHQRAYRIHVLKDYIKSKYVYYYMQAYFYNFILKSAVGSTVSSIRKGMIENFEIPIPSLKTQERIVKILDTMVDHFTQLEAELEAELEARNKQYEHYRYKLLSEKYLNKLTKKFGGEIDCQELGNICEILDYKRKPVKKSDRILGEYPYYGANGIQDYINDYIFDGTFLLMGEDGSVMDEHNRPILHWVDNKKIWVNNHAHVLAEKNKNYNLRYIYYFLSNSDVSDIVNGLPPKINQTNLRAINILIPSLTVQKHIVSVLDNFNKIVTDINEGLPREIELRKKQYEYYRERLLDFKREDE